MNHPFVNRTIALFFFLLNIIFILGAQTVRYDKISKNGQEYYIYKVKTGEGLYAVSREFGVSIEAIKKNNPGVDNGLQNGQQLIIPVQSNNMSVAPNNNNVLQNVVPPSPDQNHTFRHTVARGETLYAISQMYNTSVDEIIRYNEGLNENIAEGQVIIIPQQRTSTAEPTAENFRYHTILAKETLYSVSKTYAVKPEDLVNANPGLSTETFQTGKTIRVPLSQPQNIYTPYENQTQNVVHRVKKGETLYSISKAFDVSVESIQKNNPSLSAGLKTNMELIIPIKKTSLDENQRVKEIEANRLLTKAGESHKPNAIRVGLLLPFLDKSDDQHLRLQEYYEGFLLSVKRMKELGANIEVYVFEIGSRAKLESLLGTLEMESLHLLIGGMTDDQIKIMSDFSKKHNIKYVIPFSSKNTEVLNNPNIFQVNTPHSYLYSKASGVFMNTFKDANVIIVDAAGKSDKTDFLNILKSDLKKKNVRYETLNVSSTLASNLSQALKTNKTNVIVPSTGDSGSLREIIQALNTAKGESENQYDVQLFGYPEWQTFSADMIKSLHQTGSYFYSSFYVDETSPDVTKFTADFKNWYGRDLIKTYPKYGIFGYDTGMFFINAIYRYGVNFEQRITRVPSNSLQFAFNFERVSNWGGFINTGLFLIQFDRNGQVVKINKSN